MLSTNSNNDLAIEVWVLRLTNNDFCLSFEPWRKVSALLQHRALVYVVLLQNVRLRESWVVLMTEAATAKSVILENRTQTAHINGSCFERRLFACREPECCELPLPDDIGREILGAERGRSLFINVIFKWMQQKCEYALRALRSGNDCMCRGYFTATPSYTRSQMKA